MRSTSFGTAMLLGFVIALPAAAQDAKGKKGNKDSVETINSDKLSAGEYIGKVKVTPGSDNEFTLEVQFPHLELKNPNQMPKSNNTQINNIYRDQQNITKLQNNLLASKNANTYARNLQSLQNAMNKLQIDQAKAGMTAAQSPYKTVYVKKDVAFHSAESMKVRTANLPEAFDDKGEPKKYTAEEKAALKGKDKNLPGYEAKLEDLTMGQTVKVTIKAAPKKAAPKEADMVKEEDKVKDEGPKMISTMIVILAEGDGKDTTPTKPGKKK